MATRKPNRVEVDGVDEREDEETAEPAVDKSPSPLPDRSPRLVVERAFSGRARDPRVAAFVHVERLQSRGSIRKQTQAAWEAEFQAFLQQPR